MPLAVLTSLVFLVETADGRWAPGIGDPTLLGWVTVAAYFGCAVICYRASQRRLRAATGWRLRWAWIGLSVLMVALGINKQLDLQSLLTQVARELAQRDGWYESRRDVQVAFIRGAVLGGAAVLAGAGLWLRHHLRDLALAGVGSAFIVVFVVVRAASFHNVDAFLADGPGGLRMNWVLELGGIACIALGARRYLRRPGRPGRPARPAAQS